MRIPLPPLLPLPALLPLPPGSACPPLPPLPSDDSECDPPQERATATPTHDASASFDFAVIASSTTPLRGDDDVHTPDRTIVVAVVDHEHADVVARPEAESTHVPDKFGRVLL